MKLVRFLFSRELVSLGIHDLLAHRLRSFLTALGMIFGVAAVICMLSIGEGASAEQLARIRLLGSENIIIHSIEPPKSTSASDAQDSVQKYGITEHDLERIAALPHISEIVRMREVADSANYIAKKFDASVIGTSPNLFHVVNLAIARGRALTAADNDGGQKVCVIGSAVARTLFDLEDPLGRVITVVNFSSGPIPYEVVGVLGETKLGGASKEQATERDSNKNIFIPFDVADKRYGTLKVRWSRSNREMKQVQYSDAIIRIDDQDNVMATGPLIERALSFGRRNDLRDYAITVPLALLADAEQTKRQRQLVLGSIAGISLLVGGIGIMNIMLASVTERTREIGIRRALGAKRHHITAQFLVETVLLSVCGGVIGILLGVSMAYLVTKWANWQTIISWWSVFVSFIVSAAVGIGFGLYPARAAARLDPIEALNAKR